MTDVRQDLTQVAGALADLARQASYVAIGAGILGLQKAQVRRREMANVAGRFAVLLLNFWHALLRNLSPA